MNNLLNYEAAKKELMKKMLSAWEYDEALKKLVRKYKI
jgi:hypothetical protein